MHSLRQHIVLRARQAVRASRPSLPRLTARQCSSSNEGGARLWGGRFTGATDPIMEQFNASIQFDKRLCFVDVEGSRQYAQALAQSGILTSGEANQICDGLDKVEEEWRSGKFTLHAGDEDIHTANERRLTELIGSVARKLHTGRSRNDQVATDLRLWLREYTGVLHESMLALIQATLDRAEEEVDFIMPGYTHLQPAQPIRWSHWLLSYATAWVRDLERLQVIRQTMNVMPLGSGALAGHPFGIDRHALATKLQFASPSINSLDAVSDRDYVCEVMFWASMVSIHLSRWAEDLIIYSTSEFKFVTHSDAYSTGSSLMPQKKNPDALELLRGKSGRVMGKLYGFMVTLKGLPSTYNKDLQEDKEGLFDVVDTLAATLPIATGVMSTMTPHPDNMRVSLTLEMLATDLADYLVRRGVPFRDAHHVAGEAVVLSETSGTPLNELTLAQLQELHPAFEDDVMKVWNFESSVESRSAFGGTSRAAVLEQVKELRASLNTTWSKTATPKSKL